MVTKGQLLERPVVIPVPDGDVGDICLDGIFLRGGSPPLLVASPLPSTGGSMASPAVNELAYAASYSERASLRLDYRGVGASEGEQSDSLPDAVADLLQGAEFLLESAQGGASAAPQLALGGFHTGCWAALALAAQDPRVDRLVLACPPGEDPPQDVPSYGELGRPILVLYPRELPELPRERERAKAAGNVRLELVPGLDRTMREGLGLIVRLVPAFLGSDPRALAREQGQPSLRESLGRSLKRRR